MATDQGPVVQSALLRGELVRLRRDSGLTQEQVASDLEWSPSKLIRVEGGRSAITKVDLDALLTKYGVSSDSQRERLHALNRGARERAWWDTYRDDLNPEYVGVEGCETPMAFSCEDQLTSAAELVVMLFPVDPSVDTAPRAMHTASTEKQLSYLARLMRRIGLQARLSVPGSHATEMLHVLRQVSIVLAWVVLMIGTLAIMAPAGMAPRLIITVVTIEFFGFVTGTLALRKPRKDK